MFYKFPVIEHLDQVREAIDGRDEFIVAEREWGFVANYLVNLIDSFPEPTTKDDKLNNHYCIRRECRGIMFDVNERIMSRPLHKFFNVGEKAETDINKLDVSKNHLVLNKVDGSFIRPFRSSDGILRWGTKMGETDVANNALEFVNKKSKYIDMGNWLCDHGFTGIFEWTSRKNRIVLDYPEDNLILLAIRHNITGEYIKYR